jgi:3-isopropylmalate dehydratase small subunit
MEPFRKLRGTAVPMLEDNVDTDAIAPLDPSRRPDYAKMLFRRRREAARAAGDPFLLDRDAFRDGCIFVAGENFGCGSSRESAVWALAAGGYRCIVARSFADAFRQNCLRNGVLPVVLSPDDATVFEEAVTSASGAPRFTVDLAEQRIEDEGGRVFSFMFDPHEKHALLNGLDDIGLTLESLVAICAWEARTARERPYMQHPSKAPA